MSAQNLNSVVITGNLTRDPELRHTGGGTAVCDLRVAVNGRRKNSQGAWIDDPNYFDVTVWGAHGAACAEYLAKGRPVAVEGRLDWSEWEAKDGGKRQAVRIVASTVQFLGSKPQGEGEKSGSAETTTENNGQEEIAAEAPVEADPAGAGAASEEEIPF